MVLLCCAALLKRPADVKGFSIQSAPRSLSALSPLSSSTLLRAEKDKASRPSLQELIDETIESNRKLVVVTGGVVSGIGKGGKRSLKYHVRSTVFDL